MECRGGDVRQESRRIPTLLITFYSQASEVDSSERARNWRSVSLPEMLTRVWTCVPSLRRLPASNTSIFAEPFLTKPDFQLRALGAYSPSVSFSWNMPSSRSSRHPVTVVEIDSKSCFAATARDSIIGVPVRAAVFVATAFT